MDTYNSKYYEPLEQMMAIRHQYMSKILRDHSGQDIYEFFKNKKILGYATDVIKGEFEEKFNSTNEKNLHIYICRFLKNRSISRALASKWLITMLNNKELKIIKLDIDRNKQKQIIYLKKIKIILLKIKVSKS